LRNVQEPATTGDTEVHRGKPTEQKLLVEKGFLGVLCASAVKLFDFNSELNSELEAV